MIWLIVSTPFEFVDANLIKLKIRTEAVVPWHSTVPDKASNTLELYNYFPPVSHLGVLLLER